MYQVARGPVPVVGDHWSKVHDEHSKTSITNHKNLDKFVDSKE